MELNSTKRYLKVKLVDYHETYGIIAADELPEGRKLKAYNEIKGAWIFPIPAPLLPVTLSHRKYNYLSQRTHKIDTLRNWYLAPHFWS